MDAFWEGRFEQQFTDDDIMWECCICMQPKVPYVTLVPCGHSLCKNCSTAVAKCPTCRKPVEKRTDGHELTQMVLSRIVYRCTTDGCSFRGTEREARDHICRVYRYRELGPHIPDDEFKTLVLQLPESAPDSDVLDEIQKAELRYNPPSPPVPAALEPPEAVVYWDYDNLPPRGVGATFESFLEGLHDALRANGIVVKHTAAYLVNGKDYGNDLERLGKALVSVQLCGTKREQADRNMSDDMRRRASELGKRGVFVIVSSDQDFNSDAQFLGLRHDVWVVHNAIPGSDHERLLGLSATGLLRVSEFVRPVTPPRYRGGLRTLSQEVTGTAQRRNRAPVPVPQATTLRIGQVDVPVSAVLRNEGFNLLENGTLATGKWCTKTTNHDPKTCTYMHVAPGYLNAEYMARPVTDFVANAGVEYLQSHPWVSGQWCLNESPHDPSTCRFLHPAPGVAHLYGLTLDDGAATVQSETPTLAPAAITVVFVDGAETPVEELVDNDALAYLRAHPRSNGRTCNNSSPTHDASKCKYVHRKAPAVTVLVDGIATPG